jgi:hypothetical protein
MTSTWTRTIYWPSPGIIIDASLMLDKPASLFQERFSLAFVLAHQIAVPQHKPILCNQRWMMGS